MTTEEKASLLSGANFWNTKPIERLNIPSIMMTDGPHGLRKQGGKADHLGLNDSVPATCYPTAAGLACSWDEALLEEMGSVLGKEAASQSVSVLLGPGVNIKRNPLCGRNFEYYSEDPYLSGKMAAALIRGIQSAGISACVKHYAVNSQEHLRMTNDSVIDERTLREIYLPAFEMAVKEGQVKCVMSSYNKVNGTYAHEHPYLLRKVLMEEWGFEGVVVSDWGGNNDRVASVKAGGTLEMPSCNGQTDAHLVDAVRMGALDEAVLDEQVDRMLDLIMTTKIDTQGERFDAEAGHRMCERVAEHMAVLLKNEDNILPLSGQRVAVIGDFASHPRYQGAGSSKINPAKLENGLQALRDAGINVTGYAQGFLRNGKRNERLKEEAVALAREAEVALLWLGLDEGDEAECIDREHMSLAENQLELVRAVAAVQKNTVAILSCGCVVDMRWDEPVRAVIHAYLGGQAGAKAIASILNGSVNPSGKLAETIPLCYEDVSSAAYYPGREATGEYREGIYVGYRYYDTAHKAVRYPFGFGLSYTTFSYHDLRVTEDAVRFRIRNDGTCYGEEIAQLYVHAATGGMFRPEQELKGFAKVALQPGEEREVSIPLNDRSFSVWSILDKDWVAEPGAYEIRIGASSRDIRLSQTLHRDGTAVENPYTDAAFAPYVTADVKNVPDESFRALLGHEIPPTRWDRNAPVGFNDAIAQGAYLRGGIGKLIYRIVLLVRRIQLRLGRKEAAANVMFVMNLPWRGVARMSGFLNDKKVHALLKRINRGRRS